MSAGERYDVVVIGSGLGGLASAVFLAKEGKKVCVLEKNKQFGGNLQTFARKKKIFDTGVHYIGGLAKGQNLYQYFSYLGIMDQLTLKRMPTVFDKIHFAEEEFDYPIAQGYPQFVEALSAIFPAEESAIKQYVVDLQALCRCFPLYNLQTATYSDSPHRELSVQAYMEKLTDNKRLQAVLVGNNFLYAGDRDKTPFFVHALTVNSYMQSAYQCVLGGSQLAKLLIKELRRLGGVAYKNEEVLQYTVEENKVQAVTTAAGNSYYATQFIANTDPKATLKLIGAAYFKPAYYKRIQGLPVTSSSFSIHLIVKPGSIAYEPANVYHHCCDGQVWEAVQNKGKEWPLMYMLSMIEDKACPGFAESLTALTYMDFDAVAAWEQTKNTVKEQADRGASYTAFKEEKMQVMVDLLAQRIPDLADTILYRYAATPLSYRDYIGSHQGNLYGHVKDVDQPLLNFISPKCKLENLFFTGQGVNMHGILGVTIGAVATCSTILGGNYLLDKINAFLAERD